MIDVASSRKASEPAWDLYDVLEHMPLPAGTWVQVTDGRVGKVKEDNGELMVELVWTVTAQGDIKSSGGSNVALKDLGAHKQVYVWTENQLANCKLEAEAMDRKDPMESGDTTHWFGGTVVNTDFLQGHTHMTLLVWIWVTGHGSLASPTGFDRQLPIAHADVHHVYNLMLCLPTIPTSTHLRSGRNHQRQ